MSSQHSNHKCPEVGACLIYYKNDKEAQVAEQRKQGGSTEVEVRKERWKTK